MSSSEELTGQSYVPVMAVGLVHYPVLDSQKQTVATNVTHFDVHDIARACRVYGVSDYFIIHPAEDQLSYVERILDHWRIGFGAKFNAKRRTALTMVKTAKSLDQALELWGQKNALVVATHARSVEGANYYTFAELKAVMYDQKRPVFLILGTGAGLTQEFMKNNCGGILEGIRGAPPGDYRHLSVRSAASIMLDRLMGPW